MVNRSILHLFPALRGGGGGGLEVALYELTYYHRWLNSTGRTTLKIPDGYYNACELDDVLQPLGTELRLHAPTGRLKLSAEKRLVLNRRLADPLGFSRDTFEPGKTYTADEPLRLAVYREICVHLAEISTTENLHNGAPSTLLRSVPVKNERCGVVGQRHSPACSTNGWHQGLFLS